MSEALSLYAPRESAVHNLHPLTKLALAGFLLATGLSAPGVWTNYILFALLVLPLAAWGRVLPELLSKSWKIVLPFAISVFLIQGFLWPGGTPVVEIGPFSLKSEGLTFAVASTGRILMVMSSFLWFALTTRPDRLMTALAQRGLPSILAYIIVATIQIAPRFQARARTILEAQQARGLETGGSFSRRAKALLPLVIPLILSSLVDVEERALAIESRAFSHHGPKTSLVAIGESGWERPLRWILVAGMAAVVAAGIWWRVGR
jgi:energy-coupling factor transport system permease protein